MKSYLKLISFLIVIFSKASFALQPYVGIEGHARYCSLSSVTNFTFDPHAFFGLRLKDSFGIEGGFNVSEAHGTKNFYNLRAFHLDALFDVPLDEKFSFLFSLGASYYRAKLSNFDKKSVFILTDALSTDDNPEDMKRHSWIGAETHAKKYQLVPRFMIGLEYSLTDNVSLRNSFTWEHTSLIRGNNFKLKNSLSYGLGLVYHF